MHCVFHTVTFIWKHIHDEARITNDHYNLVELLTVIAEVTCSPPALPSNSYTSDQAALLSGSPYLYAVNAECSLGHRTEHGQSALEITCDEQGNWTGLNFTCQGIMFNYLAIQHNEIN